jgi:hypothetical protein
MAAQNAAPPSDVSSARRPGGIEDYESAPYIVKTEIGKVSFVLPHVVSVDRPGVLIFVVSGIVCHCLSWLSQGMSSDAYSILPMFSKLEAACHCLRRC